MRHLGFQRPLLYLRNALLDDEGDAIRAALRSLGEVLPEKLQLPLELLVPALDGQGFQTLLVAGQVALENTGKTRGDGRRHRGTGRRAAPERRQASLGERGQRGETPFLEPPRAHAKRTDPSPKEECLPKHGLGEVGGGPAPKVTLTPPRRLRQEGS